jgi:hypothetical protein
VSLAGVEFYVASLIDGLVVPGIANPLRAFVQPPPVTNISKSPVAYVWGGRGNEQRATIPRGGHSPFPGGAQKRTLHTIMVILQWSFRPTQENAQLFPLLIDAVLGVFRAANLQTPVIDPVTGAKSILTDLGEQMTWEYSTPVGTTPTSQQMALGMCVIRCPTREWFSG